MTEGCCSAADEQVARDDHSSDDYSPDDGTARQRKAVRERYARIATEGGSCGDDADEGDASCGESDTCCGEGDAPSRPADYDRALGYTDADVETVGDGANLRLGCGNPTALAALRPGETVLDLGSGAGFDCFLAAREVGSSGRVVGVDMTPEMVERARANARENGTTNVEFRLGEIEHLPVADASVSVVVSNCVINLSPDKPQVFREAFRVLRPGGRLAVSDVVLTAEPPSDLEPDPDSVAACVGGASPISALETMLGEAGFEDVAVRPKGESEFVREWSDDRDLTEYLVSATIEGRKPERSQGD